MFFTEKNCTKKGIKIKLAHFKVLVLTFGAGKGKICCINKSERACWGVDKVIEAREFGMSFEELGEVIRKLESQYPTKTEWKLMHQQVKSSGFFQNKLQKVLDN